MKKLGETYAAAGQELQEQYTDICNALRDIRDFVIASSNEAEMVTAAVFLKQLRKDAKYLGRLIEERSFGLNIGGNDHE